MRFPPAPGGAGLSSCCPWSGGSDSASWRRTEGGSSRAPDATLCRAAPSPSGPLPAFPDHIGKRVNSNPSLLSEGCVHKSSSVPRSLETFSEKQKACFPVRKILGGQPVSGPFTSTRPQQVQAWGSRWTVLLAQDACPVTEGLCGHFMESWSETLRSSSALFLGTGRSGSCVRL